MPRPFFNNPEWADPLGLVALGGDLSPERLLQAYRSGIFPWFGEGDPILWWSPDPRAIFELDQLHVSRRLRRTIHSERFTVTINRDFAGVMRGCAERREEGTWITSEMIEAYGTMHRLGYAHSVEVWTSRDAPKNLTTEAQRHRESTEKTSSLCASSVSSVSLWLNSSEPPLLAGGLYGVALGGFFAGESMFTRARDASKVALVYLVKHLRERGFQLFDIQFLTEHTKRLGAVEISRADYLRRLRQALACPATFRESA